MKVTLLQDDLKTIFDDRPMAAGNLLKFAARHRLGTGPLRFLQMGALTLEDGQPVVDASAAVIDSWFAADNTWTLPSRRNLARIAKLFGLPWPETFHLMLKLEWERFLIETQPIVRDGQSRSELLRLVHDDEPITDVIRLHALPIRNWPVRAFQKSDGSSVNVERYPELVEEYCDVWIGPRVADIQKEMEAALQSGIDARAFAPPEARRLAGHCYYIFIDFIVHQDIHRASIFSPLAQQFHIALHGFVKQWGAADPNDQVNCLMRLEKWHAASKAFDVAAMQMETARQSHQQIESRWYLAFGAVYSEFLEAHQRKEKLRNFLRWLKENPRLTSQELEQRYAAEHGTKDKDDFETLATGRVVAGLNERLKGEGASHEEVLEYFIDMKRMYRSIAWLTHPDRHATEVPDTVRAQLSALWLEAATIRRGEARTDTTLRRAELRRLIQRARQLCQQANLPFEERLLPFDEDLAATNEMLQREITGLESDVRRVLTELNKLAVDHDFLSKVRDLEPPEAVPERVAAYEQELEQIKQDIGYLEAEVAALQRHNAA